MNPGVILLLASLFLASLAVLVYFIVNKDTTKTPQPLPPLVTMASQAPSTPPSPAPSGFQPSSGPSYAPVPSATPARTGGTQPAPARTGGTQPAPATTGGTQPAPATTGGTGTLFNAIKGKTYRMTLNLFEYEFRFSTTSQEIDITELSSSSTVPITFTFTYTIIDDADRVITFVGDRRTTITVIFDQNFNGAATTIPGTPRLRLATCAELVSGGTWSQDAAVTQNVFRFSEDGTSVTVSGSSQQVTNNGTYEVSSSRNVLGICQIDGSGPGSFDLRPTSDDFTTLRLNASIDLTKRASSSGGTQPAPASTVPTGFNPAAVPSSPTPSGTGGTVLTKTTYTNSFGDRIQFQTGSTTTDGTFFFRQGFTGSQTGPHTYANGIVTTIAPGTTVSDSNFLSGGGFMFTGSTLNFTSTGTGSSFITTFT